MPIAPASIYRVRRTATSCKRLSPDSTLVATLVARLYVLSPGIIERAKQSLVYKLPPARQVGCVSQTHMLAATSSAWAAIVNFIGDLIADRGRFEHVLSYCGISRRLRKLAILRSQFAQIIGIFHLSAPLPDLTSASRPADIILVPAE